MQRIPHRLLTEEFKREAIKLVTEQNLNIAVAGRQLDIDPKSIRAWIAQAERGELKATLGATKLTADQLRHLHPIFKLYDLLDVARSGYQAWVGGKVIPARKLEDLRLTVAIKAAHARGRGIYGPLKIQTALAAQGVIAGIDRIKRLRTLHGTRGTHQRKLRVTTDSKHLLPVARNILDRQFACTAPNQVWVADMTYIPTGETVKVFTANLSR